MEQTDGYQKFPVFLFRVGTKIRAIPPIIKIHPPNFLEVFTHKIFVNDLYRMVSTDCFYVLVAQLCIVLRTICI
jgi:hypothetical protein